MLSAATVAALLASCGAGSPSSGSTAGTDGPSFGVDRVEWPGSVEDARALVDDLPDDLGGDLRDETPAEEDFAAEFAYVAYADGTSLMASDGDFSGIPAEDTDAQDKLSAMFGLGYTCDPDTYDGTIELSRLVPGTDPVPDGEVAWFACRIDGMEGNESFEALALGWTSTTEVAWLVVAPDEAAVRRLVSAMQGALG